MRNAFSLQYENWMETAHKRALFPFILEGPTQSNQAGIPLFVSRNESDGAQEIQHLKLAKSLDQHFFGHDLRLARILSETDQSASYEHFSAALQSSSFDFGIVNDYGVFLIEQRKKEEFKEWAKIGRGLFPRPSIAERQFWKDAV